MIDAAGEVYDLGEYVIDISGKYDLNRQGIYTISVRGVGELGVRTEKNMTLYII